MAQNVFFSTNHKNRHATGASSQVPMASGGWGLLLHTPVYDAVSYTNLLSMQFKIETFFEQKFLTGVKPPSPQQNSGCAPGPMYENSQD